MATVTTPKDRAHREREQARKYYGGYRTDKVVAYHEALVALPEHPSARDVMAAYRKHIGKIPPEFLMGCCSECDAWTATIVWLGQRTGVCPPCLRAALDLVEAT